MWMISFYEVALVHIGLLHTLKYQPILSKKIFKCLLPRLHLAGDYFLTRKQHLDYFKFHIRIVRDNNRLTESVWIIQSYICCTNSKLLFINGCEWINVEFFQTLNNLERFSIEECLKITRDTESFSNLPKSDY